MPIIITRCPHCGKEIYTAVFVRSDLNLTEYRDPIVFPTVFEMRYTLAEFIEKFVNTDMAEQIVTLEFKISSLKDHLQRIVNHL